MTCNPHNGHSSWNTWNVALWIASDEPLYRFAIECNRDAKNATQAVRRFLDVIGDGSKTPDGGVYNFKCVREAIAGLE